jgi:hypothetical protein
MNENVNDVNQEEPEPPKETWIAAILGLNSEDPLIVTILDRYGKFFVIGTVIIFFWQFEFGGLNRFVSSFFSMLGGIFTGVLIIVLAAILRSLLRIEILLERNQKMGVRSKAMPLPSRARS